MAIPAKILEERQARAGMYIADVRLVDGSKETGSTTTEYASLPVTLFFKDATELTLFKTAVTEKKPLLFMCLEGKSKDGQIQVKTVKKSFVVAGSRRPQVPRHGRGSSEDVWSCDGSYARRSRVGGDLRVWQTQRCMRIVRERLRAGHDERGFNCS